MNVIYLEEYILPNGLIIFTRFLVKYKTIYQLSLMNEDIFGNHSYFRDSYWIQASRYNEDFLELFMVFMNYLLPFNGGSEVSIILITYSTFCFVFSILKNTYDFILCYGNYFPWKLIPLVFINILLKIYIYIFRLIWKLLQGNLLYFWVFWLSLVA